MPACPHVVVVGSGFGGLATARRLARAEVDVTVVDRDNYHGFWPLLYQVATAALGPDDIAQPVRAVLEGLPDVRVLLGTVTAVDLGARRVDIEDEPPLHYDYLVLATGTSSNDFGIDGVADHAFPLKTLPDAIRLRNHILLTFEHAAAHPDADDEAAMTVVMVGGGSTGVEMSGAIAELFVDNLAHDFATLDLHKARVVIVEMTDHLLPGFSSRAEEEARRILELKGVEIRTGTELARVMPDGVELGDGTTIKAHTVVWTAGVQANALAATVDTEKGKGGALKVAPDLSLPGHPEVFVIGDLAAATGRHGQPLPQVAQVAIQGGKHVARTIGRRLEGRPGRRFRYHDHGSMATIGRKAAVADLPGGIHLTGTIGWLSWLVVHIVFLGGLRNRVVVLLSWAVNFVTGDRSARVILDDAVHTPGGGST